MSPNHGTLPTSIEVSVPSIRMPQTRPDGFPRRNDLTLLTPVERELFEMMQKIDQLPGNTTAVVILLNEARGLLADYVEHQPTPVRNEPRFERLPNGDVKVLAASPGEIVIDKHRWYSIIANVSYYGEEDYGFYRAANFHDKTPIHPTCKLKDKPLRDPTAYDDGTVGTE